jgi:CheY-like chemotaxis protein
MKLSKKIRIWIVEDDADEQLFLQEGFNKTGLFDIERFFFNGQELLEELKATHMEALPEIILSDLNMPLLNGVETLQKVKSHHAFSKIPFVIFSVCDELSALELCYSQKVDAFIPKPLQMTRYDAFALELKEVYEHIYEDQIGEY